MIFGLKIVQDDIKWPSKDCILVPTSLFWLFVGWRWKVGGQKRHKVNGPQKMELDGPQKTMGGQKCMDVGGP